MVKHIIVKFIKVKPIIKLIIDIIALKANKAKLYLFKVNKLILKQHITV